MKLFEKESEERLRKLIKVDCRQSGFNQGRSTANTIFVMRQLQKFGEKTKKLYHVFLDLEKAFNRVPRKVIEWGLRRQKVPRRLIGTVMSLYVESRSKVNTVAGASDFFIIGVEVHLGSSLSPMLFSL